VLFSPFLFVFCIVKVLFPVILIFKLFFHYFLTSRCAFWYGQPFYGQQSMFTPISVHHFHCRWRCEYPSATPRTHFAFRLPMAPLQSSVILVFFFPLQAFRTAER
jgi:hypothetical protein